MLPVLPPPTPDDFPPPGVPFDDEPPDEADVEFPLPESPSWFWLPSSMLAVHAESDPQSAAASSDRDHIADLNPSRGLTKLRCTLLPFFTALIAIRTK